MQRIGFQASSSGKVPLVACHSRGKSGSSSLLTVSQGFRVRPDDLLLDWSDLVAFVVVFATSPVRFCGRQQSRQKRSGNDFARR